MDKTYKELGNAKIDISLVELYLLTKSLNGEDVKNHPRYQECRHKVLNILEDLIRYCEKAEHETV